MAGLTALLIGQSFEIVSLLAMAVSRAASAGFLRLATLFLAQAFDLSTFIVMVSRHGLDAEANPLVSDLFYSLGLPAVVAAKFALVVAIAALAVASSARGRRGIWSVIGGVPLALAIAAGLIGGITNAATYLQ